MNVRWFDSSSVGGAAWSGIRQFCNHLSHCLFWIIHSLIRLNFGFDSLVVEVQHTFQYFCIFLLLVQHNCFYDSHLQKDWHTIADSRYINNTSQVIFTLYIPWYLIIFILQLITFDTALISLFLFQNHLPLLTKGSPGKTWNLKVCQLKSCKII